MELTNDSDSALGFVSDVTELSVLCGRSMIVVHHGIYTRVLDHQCFDYSSHAMTVLFHVLQPGMSLPDNIRSLFGAIPGAMQRGSAISSMAGPGFITGAEANQTHAQAGTRAGGWAEGMSSNANAVNGLAGIPLTCTPCVPQKTSLCLSAFCLETA